MTRARDNASEISSVQAKGDVLVGTAAGAQSRLAVGTNNQALVADSTTATGTKWATPTDTTKIPLSTVTAAGDLIVGSGSGAVTNLAIGANGTYLTSNGTAASWGSISAGSLTQLATGTLSGTSVSMTGIPTGYNDLLVVVRNPYATANGISFYTRLNNYSTADYIQQWTYSTSTVINNTSAQNAFYSGNNALMPGSSTWNNSIIIRIYDYTSTTSAKIMESLNLSINTGVFEQGRGGAQGSTLRTSAINRVDLFAGGTFAGGTYTLYGVK